MKGSYFLKAGFLAGLVLLIAGQVHGADPDTLYVRHVEGLVELAEGGSQQWMEAAVNTPLIEGDTVRTGVPGKAELLLKDGSLVRVGNNSSLKVIAVEPKGVEFRLERGMAYVVAAGSKEVPIFFDTPSAALDITMPATLRIDAYDGGISEVSVYKGEVYAVQQKGRMPVGAGERIVLRMDGSAPVLAALRAGDEWLRWNTDRDRAMLPTYGTSESYAYLPDELRTYSSDLDANGQWVYTPEYDYVWVPTVITVGTWSPYRFGRWVWIGGSYVWIGYEPWGWAPYHYGRWVHHSRAGWCWVPPARGHVRWEPAHVAWVYSSRNIGWVPLAPGETYDRRKAPVIHQTNNYAIYNNVTLERSVSTARTTYRNAAVANSVVTMERDSLLRAKAVSVNVAKKGAVPLKTVSLPAGVVPARTKSGPAQPVDAQKRATGAPAQVRPAGAPARGVSPAVEPRAPSAAAQKTTVAPAGTRTPGSTPSLSTRIERAQAPGAQSAGQASQRPQAPNAASTRMTSPENSKNPGTPEKMNGSGPGTVRTVSGAAAPAAVQTKGQASVRPLAERINTGRSSSAPGPVPPASNARSAAAPSTAGSRATTSQAPEAVQGRTQAAPAPVTPQPARSVQGPAQAAGTFGRPPVVTGGNNQGPAAPRTAERREVVAPKNVPAVQAPAPTRTQAAPVTPQPSQPVAKAPDPPRQAAPRSEQKPAAVRNEKPQPQPAKQSPEKEKVDAPAAAAAPGKADNPSPTSMNGGRREAQQNTPLRPSRN